MADKITFSVTGDKEILAKLRKFGSGALQEAGASLYRSGHRIITISKESRCPVLTGALRSTLDVKFPEYQGQTVVVKLIAGGPAAPYALAVHENMDAAVNWTVPGTGPKYLENPAKENTQEILDDLRADLLAFAETLS